MTSNFIFLREDYNLLYNIAYLSEKNLYSDPNTCMFKLRQFSEVMVNEIFQIEHIPIPTEHNQATKINTLKKEGIIEPIIVDLFHQLRLKGNDAVHSVYASQKSAETLLRMAYQLARWFALAYGEGTKGHSEFVLPEKHSISVEDLKAEKEAQEKQIETLLNQLFELQKQKEYLEESQSKEFLSAQKERVKKSQKYAGQLNLSEEETRKIIDAQLQEAGWQADSIHLKYSQGIRPEKGKNIAIAEFPTDKGNADYALFAGLKLVGIVEAKPEYKDISAIIANQCKDYATHIKSEHSEYIIGKWGTYQVPFVFATNGRKYLKQLETKSGIWFLDTRRNDNIPKALQSWKSPQGLLEDLEKDIEKANQKLAETPYDLLRDKDGLNLREYQIKAVETTERELLKGKTSILLSMATGTGKTRTLLAMMYRFLKTQRFKRILFLVDRTSLGEQAHDVFKEVRLEDLQTLANIYNIKGLEDKTIERETKIHLSTVQAMVKRILYNEGENIPSVSDYDLIIIDEAHRGYTLDKEMADDELEFRNQDDFISKYRSVIDYFDAVKIAVTATPALHTTEIFGKPVFEYSYREAVLDGFLVDYNLPHQIITQLRKEGIHYQKGDTIQIFDPEKNEITDFSEIEDELNFDIEQFNKKVIVEDFNRVVLTEIAQDLDPEGQGKTLIFAVDDQHADLIVKILKEIYAEQGIDNDAVKKITGSIGDKKRVSEAIKQFKNERYPNIAVTVDLLTTGIDVPEITSLVFLRRVKSRILFEQMLGRATRLCPKINKENFEIYDPVGVFESIVDFTKMTPVAANPSASFEDIIRGIDHSDEASSVKKYVNQLIGRLQRRVKNIVKQDEDYFLNLQKTTPQEFIRELKEQPIDEVKIFIQNHRKAIEFLFHSKSKSNHYKIISDKTDQVAERYQGYGGAEQRPEDYIEAFRTFITENQNRIAALNILCTRPKELTRNELRSLRLEMEQAGYSIREINHAWNKAKNVDITADIIGIVRTLALGSALVDYSVRLENAFKKLKAHRQFTKIEEKWLDRIEKYLVKEQFIDHESFNTGAFKNEGGYEKINKAFKNQLDEIVDELKEYLFVV
ncbi:type I restriction-modification system endonuclease [Capnocytophaga canimorsus]|uniref:type I restriction-modification system endonuclease n=1 Tax=Capnocytophaga canimorsus TaxID=28188 RepID=UPI0028EA8D81|nr:type I restriction-modification system endonuclease [Capnocytophaga canimorsus]MDT9500348.1 type I restriction-modification system endonuclease [Capnocytophaga canimorsus]